MILGIIGNGAISQYVQAKARSSGHQIRSILLRSERCQELAEENKDLNCVSRVADFPDDIDHVVDCAGHSALKTYGPDILRGGTDLTTVSIGALADPDVYQSLEQAATEGGAKLRLASGAIGALDCLLAARSGELQHVTYVGRKPPQGWRGSPAEDLLDLDNLKGEAVVHFDGSARDAATHYPKNANVAAAVALAGIGFDDTQVKLIADPNISQNTHEVRATGDFGRFSFEIQGHCLPDNPRSSALAAMSMLSALDRESHSIVF